MIDYNEVELFAQLANQQISNGAVEDVLRHLLSTHLNAMFPQSPYWIQAHADGTEKYLHFSDENGVARGGYADVVVGKTAIEYEKNLTISTIFAEGYKQVKEYCAGLYNQGIRENDILGILSDTVRWYGYSISIVGEATNGVFGVNNIVLNELAFVDLSIGTELEFEKFGMFIDKFLDRVQMYPLEASRLATDFGMESNFYCRNIEALAAIVSRAMSENERYADLIKRVWQNFIAYLGASDFGEFSQEVYVNELYLVTVAKVIGANIISKKPLISNEEEIIRILNGKYFEANNISNLVDYDYFGWLNSAPYVSDIARYAINIQRQLSSYDFTEFINQDLFGALLAQLAKKEHRLLLGQEFTPHWVAQDMVHKSLQRLNTEPCVLDMCCGSGIFLIETIKYVRSQYNIEPDSYDDIKDKVIFSCVTGFDIDPLAIMLAKVNWVMAMNDLFQLHRGQIIIPIYHADSMFTTTPITESMTDDGASDVLLRFDEQTIVLPSLLMTPEYKKAYDSLLNSSYHIAMIRAKGQESELQDEFVSRLIEKAENDSDVSFAPDFSIQVINGAHDLIIQLERMQREGRNGIWYFILNNSYRPSLVRNQFNCILSNPPWLAMSRLADNPYKAALAAKSERFGIKPMGASHLHTELATTFLLNAVEKYLTDEGICYCVMPGSLLGGYNHERIRRRNYVNIETPVQLAIDDIWELPKLTFKNKAIVLGGKKANVDAVISGRIYENSENYLECQYVLKLQGTRSAWVVSTFNEGLEELLVENPLTFNQGADLFPRTLLFHKFVHQDNGNWQFGRIMPNDEKYYLINECKKTIGSDLETTNFEDAYLYKALISKHLSPFYICEPDDIIIPGRREGDVWYGLLEQDFALMNDSTRNVFEQMQILMEKSLETWLLEDINIRSKLSKQRFSDEGWLIISNAGGKNPCAAYVPLNRMQCSRLVIDQTLYWYVANSEDEAKYIVGLLNSRALAELIMDFQPQGEFGQRHIHTIPYKVMPRYDNDNPMHEHLVLKTEILMNEYYALCNEEELTNLFMPSSGSLPSRRKRLQKAISGLPSYEEYEEACRFVLLG